MRPPFDDSVDVEHSPRPGSGAMVAALRYTIPPQADAGWIGAAGPGPS
jgi:hypothetical protein